MSQATFFTRCLFGLGVIWASHTVSAGTVITDAPLQQHWVKRGLVLKPGFAGPQSSRFVSSPSVVKLENGRLRMYVWVADGTPPWLHGSQIILAAEADPADPLHWKLVSKKPLVGPDPHSKIRERGVGFPYVLPRSDAPWLMYYGTWDSTYTTKHELTNRLGLAISDDRGMTWRVTNESILPSGPPGSFDSGAIPSAAVLRNRDGSYVMWYTAAGKYIPFGSINQGILHIGTARSSDGIHWGKSGVPALRAREGAASPFEACLTRPAVLRINGVYHMWLSVYDMAPGSRPGSVLQKPAKGREVERKATAAGSYHLEYARSSDGVNWTRYAGQSIMPLTPGGFDSHSQSYASVVDMGDQIWLFYTGDGLGSTGVGLATLDKDELHSE